MKRRPLSLLILLLGMPAIVAVAAPATSGPATAAAPASYATPEDAARSYIRARFAKDATRTREAVELSAGRKADVEAALDAMIASDALQKEAVFHFGVDGRKLFDPDNAGALAAALDTLDKSHSEIAGDKATITAPVDAEGKPAAVTALVKTSAGWKIDGASLVDGGDAGEVTRRVELFKKGAEVAKKVTAGISANKYPAASDAYRDYVKLIGQAARAVSAPATVHDTVPATLPASAPAPRP